ncbi:MAG: Serine/threonine-protein kinase PknD [Planctomycetes bacterium]|nr:Serine/threonine-protein kinase PknD [Planctomycetota bacterium]
MEPRRADRIDEERRRAFEAHRLAGGTDPLDRFLPAPDAPGFTATLEEFVIIDIELRRAAAGGDFDVDGALRAHASRHPRLADADAWTRLRRAVSDLASAPVAGVAGGRVGRFILAEPLGEGSFAKVWRAADPVLGRDVALKVLHAGLAPDRDARERMLREARSAARLHHPGIVPVHDSGEDRGSVWIAAEFVPGRTLAAEASLRRIPPDEAARIVERVAEALQYAHDCGVVHRDVKPANILLAPDGRPLLADFGLARVDGSGGTLTTRGDILGTPAYISPEQARGDSDAVGPRSDIYSLGAVLYELLAGRPPFSGSAASVLRSAAWEDPPALRDLATVPRDLETICLAAMAKEPARRYPSAAAFAADLRRFAERRPISARRASVLGRIALWVRREPAAAAVLGVSVVAVGAVAAVGAAGVLEERDRYREERDRAERNLVRSLEREAAAVLAARDTGWYGRALSGVLEATVLDAARAGGGSSPRLRDLLVSVECAPGVSFEPAGEWRRAGTTTALAGSAERVFGVANGGRVWSAHWSTGRDWTESAVTAAGEPCLAASADGERVFVSTDEGGAILDGRTLVETAVFGCRGVRCATFSRDGAALAAGMNDGTLVVAGADGAVRSVTHAHAGAVLGLEFAPDGRTVATCGADGAIVVHDLRTGARRTEATAPDPVRAVALRAGGTAVAFATAESFGFETLALGRGAAPVRHHGVHGAAVRRLVDLPDWGVLSASSDGTLAVHASPTDRVAVAQGGFAPVLDVALAGSPGAIWAAHADGVLRVWRLQEPRARRRFHTAHRAAFVPGTSILATDRGVLDASTGALRTFARPPITAVASDGELVASGAADGAIRVHRGARVTATLRAADAVAAVALRGGRLAAGTVTGDVLLASADGGGARTFPAGVGGVLGLALLPDGGAVAVCDLGLAAVSADGAVRVIDRAARSAGAAASHGDVVAIGAADGVIELRDATLGTPHRVLRGHAGAATSIAISDDGTLVAAAARDQDVRVWDLRETAEPVILRSFRGGTHAVAFGPHPGMLAAAGASGGHVLSLASGTPVARMEVRGTIAIASRPGRIAVGTADGALIEYDVPPSSHSPTHPAGSSVTASRSLVAGRGPETAWGVAASPDGAHVATSSHSGEVLLWNATSLEPVRHLAERGEIAWDVTFSADGSRVAAGDGSAVNVWDVRGARIARLEGHGGLVTAVRFDGTARVLSSSRDGSIRAWSLASGVETWRRELRCGPVLCMALAESGEWLHAGTEDGTLHSFPWGPAGPPESPSPAERTATWESPVWAVACDHAGGLVATGLQDGSVELRDIPANTIVLRLPREPRCVRSLSFSSDGRWLAAGRYLGPSVVWDLDHLRGRLAGPDARPAADVGR